MDEQSRCRVGPKNLFDHPAREPHPLVHQIFPVGWPRLHMSEQEAKGHAKPVHATIRLLLRDSLWSKSLTCNGLSTTEHGSWQV